MIRNRGQLPLRLRIRFTSGRCGFSLWQGQEHVIPAGDRVAVRMTWPTPDRDGLPYANHVEIWTDDPETPRFRLRIVGITGPPAVP